MLDPEGHDVRDPDTGRLVVRPQPKVHADLHQSGIADAQMQAVREGMRRVVADGTGKRAQVTGVAVAGKSGTAQFWRGDIQDNHAWLITFTPYEKPQYALCVMVQGARSGGSVSAPIVRRILDQCLLLNHDYDPGVTKLEPAMGSFAQIDTVDYKQGPKFVAATTPDGGNSKVQVVGGESWTTCYRYQSLDARASIGTFNQVAAPVSREKTRTSIGVRLMSCSYIRAMPKANGLSAKIADFTGVPW